MVVINNINDLNEVMKVRTVPKEILNDINQRITDWLSMGGSYDHPYITRQFKFVETYLNTNSRRGRRRNK